MVEQTFGVSDQFRRIRETYDAKKSSEKPSNKSHRAWSSRHARYVHRDVNAACNIARVYVALANAASAPRRSVGATPRVQEAARRVGRVEKI